MNPLSHPAFPTFENRVAQRLSAGAVEYGDQSIGKPALELIDEIQQELEDVTGWSALLWLRLENIKAAAAKVDPAPVQTPAPESQLRAGMGCNISATVQLGD